MKLPVIRRLAESFDTERLTQAAEDFQSQGLNSLGAEGADEGDLLSNILMAIEVRKKMDKGLSLNEAIKEHTRMIQGLLKGASKAKSPEALGLFEDCDKKE